MTPGCTWEGCPQENATATLLVPSMCVLRGLPPARERCVPVHMLCCAHAGMGITREGLQALFKEYVQGTEDDMRRPRSRGGTGLGLSICSKQVSARALAGRCMCCSTTAGHGS